MSTQSSPRQRTSTTARSRGWVQRTAYRIVVRHIFRPLGRRSLPTAPTEAQRQLVLTSFILGGISIVAAIFPICGFPLAVTGLFMGLYGRHTTTLHSMSSWAVALSLIGLLLTLVNVVVTISIYFSVYFWS